MNICRIEIRTICAPAMVYGRREKYKYYFKIFKEMAIIIQINKNYNKIDYQIRLSKKNFTIVFIRTNHGMLRYHYNL